MTDHQKNSTKNTYFLDPGSPAELARLINQANMVARTMQWLFPPGVDHSAFRAVLDIACGPGNWVLDVAFHHPGIEAVGIDLSDQMVSYARARARSQRLSNGWGTVGFCLNSPCRLFGLVYLSRKKNLMLCTPEC